MEGLISNRNVEKYLEDEVFCQIWGAMKRLLETVSENGELYKHWTQVEKQNAHARKLARRIAMQQKKLEEGSDFQSTSSMYDSVYDSDDLEDMEEEEEEEEEEEDEDDVEGAEYDSYGNRVLSQLENMISVDCVDPSKSPPKKHINKDPILEDDDESYEYPMSKSG